MTEMVDFAALLQDAKTGAAWPEGDYDVEVIEAEAVTASTGSPMIKTKFRCIVGAYANKTITNNFVLTKDSPGALRMFFSHMAAFGLDDGYFASLGTGNLVPVALALRGRRARLTLGPREWPKGSGMLQNEVKAVKPITEGIAGAPTPGMLPPGVVAGPQIPQAPQVVPPQVQAQPTFVPPPPPQQSVPQAPVPQAPPAPAFVPPAPPAPQPQVQVPVAPTPQPAPAPAPVANGVPAGFTAEQWAALPEATRVMIIASTQGQPQAQPAPAAVPQASAMQPPAPPGLPV